MRLERKGLKVGPALQTRAHTPYSAPVTRVSLALNGEWGEGCWDPGLPPGFGRSRTPLSQLTPHAKPPLLRAHTLRRARTHTSDIPIVPHVTHGPERAHPSHTLTHACTHKHTRPLGHFPTPSPTPAAALQRHSLTVTHLHSFTDTHTPPTHANHRHTFINRARRSTHAPPRLLFRSPESFLPPPRAPLFPVCRHIGGPGNSLAVPSQAPRPHCVFPLTLWEDFLWVPGQGRGGPGGLPQPWCEWGRYFLFLNSGILQEEAGKLGGGPTEDVLTVVGLTPSRTGP